MFIKKLSTVLALCSIVGLFAIAPNNDAKAYSASVNLYSNDMWANSNSVSATQISVYGNISSKSKKDVSFVTEYKGTDGVWHYDKWFGAYSPNTNIPTLNSTYRTKCSMRLQLNPVGIADAGKGGIASGYVNIVSY